MYRNSIRSSNDYIPVWKVKCDAEVTGAELLSRH